MRYNDTYVRRHAMIKNKLRDNDYYSESLLEYTREALGETFKRLPLRIQTGFIKVFYNHHNIIRNNQHNQDAESITMGKDEVERYFRDQKDFNAVNMNGYWLRAKRSRHGPIEGKYVFSRLPKPGGGSIVFPNYPTRWIVRTFDACNTGVRSTNGYQLSKKIELMVGQWIQDTLKEANTPKKVANQNKDAIIRNQSNTPNTINVNTLVHINKEELMIYKATLVSLLKLIKLEQSKLEVNTDQCQEFIQEITLKVAENKEACLSIGGAKVKIELSKPLEDLIGKGINASRVNRHIKEIDQLILDSIEHQSDCVYVTYEECSTGRYFATNATLQGYSRSVRYAALKGCYEYDLEAAHQNILLQVLKHFDINFPKLDIVYEYVRNKADIRNKLAKELAMPLEQFKSVLQALTYGAEMNRSPYRSIYKYCNGDDKIIKKVINNAWLQRYMEAFKLAGVALEDKGVGSINAVGIKFVKNKDSQRMAHILQGYERQVLDVVIKHSARNNIALLLHDCVVLYNKVNPKRLSDIVKQETGVDLEFSEEKYQ